MTGNNTWRNESWSNSRIGTYRQCPRKFYLQYIMKHPKLQTTIEAFVGTIIHEFLADIYKAKKLHTSRADWDLKQWLECFETQFNDQMPKDIRILGKFKNIKTYQSAAVRILVDYWNTYEPFDEEMDGELISVERKYEMVTTAGHRLLGIIDRLTLIGPTWLIIDYKTGKTIPTNQIFLQDTQPLVYLLLVHKNYPDVPINNLYCEWRYIRKMVRMGRGTDKEELESVEEQLDTIIDNILELEVEVDFPCKESQLCWWCDVRNYCPVSQIRRARGW